MVASAAAECVLTLRVDLSRCDYHYPVVSEGRRLQMDAGTAALAKAGIEPAIAVA
jgi:hypothetical protein